MNLRKPRVPNEDVGQSVSVIVPVYNVERYIDDCMLSLRVQNYDNFEIVIVNDGSMDSSMERVRAHAAIDHRIKIIDQQNLGLGGARNTGLAHAQGDFVAFVDSDDMLTTQGLATLARAQGAGDFDVVSARFIMISDSGEVLRRETVRPLPNWVPPIAFYECVLGLFHHAGAWARLYRRSMLLDCDARFPSRLQGYEDICFTYKVLRACKHHFLDNNFIYYWRQRSRSLRTVTKAHLSIPNILRDDTREFLERVGASEREYVLAARRNILILGNLLKRSHDADAVVSKELSTLLRRERAKIMDDFYAIERSGSRELDAAPELRNMVVNMRS